MKTGDMESKEKEIRLARAGVLFDEERHEYSLPDGTPLSGVTAMLERRLFPHKYDGVPEEVLRRAAARGSFVHAACEMMDTLGVDNDAPEAAAYKALRDGEGLVHEASEYLVTDGRRYASFVDKVYRNSASGFTLADIKTTRALDTEYVRWQLSVYALLFEGQNPGAKAARLLAIWLRGDEGRIVEVRRVPDGDVRELMACDAEGREFRGLPAPAGDALPLPAKYAAMEDAIAEIDAQCRYWTGRRRELMEGVGAEMAAAGVRKWAGARVAFTLKADAGRETFDVKAFARDHPALYREYAERRPVRGGAVLRVKGQGHGKDTEP